MTLLQNFDLNLLLGIYNTCHNSIFDKIMPVISSLGNVGTVWIILSLIFLTSKKYRRTGVICLLALLFTSFMGEVILKHLIQRPRPFNEIPGVQLLISKPLTYSFPSGHTASSFAAAYIIFKEIRRLAIPAFIIAALIAFSRMYLLVHYPSDIAGGIILGILCAAAARKLFMKYEIKR